MDTRILLTAHPPRFHDAVLYFFFFLQMCSVLQLCNQAINAFRKQFFHSYSHFVFIMFFFSLFQPISINHICDRFISTCLLTLYAIFFPHNFHYISFSLNIGVTVNFRNVHRNGSFKHLISNKLKINKPMQNLYKFVVFVLFLVQYWVFYLNIQKSNG